jgi:YD repeat-containing protein
MSVFLAIVLVVAAVAALGSVRAARATRRLNKADRAQRQLLATRQPNTITTYAYDESGAVISAKTSPANPQGNETPRRVWWETYTYDDRGVETGVDVHSKQLQ